MKNVFKILDLTGSDYTLYRNKKKKSSSIIGGCLSILSYIIICIVTYSKIKEFVENKIMNTFYYNYKFSVREIERKYLSAEQDSKIFEFRIGNSEMYKSHRFMVENKNKIYILPKCGNDKDNPKFCLDIQKIGEIDRYFTLGYILFTNCRTIKMNVEIENKEELDDCTGDWWDFTNKHKNETIDIDINYKKYYYDIIAKHFVKEEDSYKVSLTSGEFANLCANTDIYEVDQIRKDLFFPINEKKTVFTFLNNGKVTRDTIGVN
jgi:hypothetical protein